MEKNILLKRLKIRKPPAEFQDEGQAMCCARGASLSELTFVPPSQVGLERDLAYIDPPTCTGVVKWHTHTRPETKCDNKAAEKLKP